VCCLVGLADVFLYVLQETPGAGPRSSTAGTHPRGTLSALALRLASTPLPAFIAQPLLRRPPFCTRTVPVPIHVTADGYRAAGGLCSVLLVKPADYPFRNG
jgi:hypothetical protein